MGFFSFFATPDTNGVGTGNLAVKQRTTWPIRSIYGPRYNVHGSLAATRLGFMKFSQEVPLVPLSGNGTYIQGQMALQSLLDLQAKANAK